MDNKVKWKRGPWYIYCECDLGNAAIDKFEGNYEARVTVKFPTQREAKAWAEKVLKVKP